jgi:hypothetical protein
MENKDMHPKILENNMCERLIKFKKLFKRNHAK